jgi:hypothetical protein
LKGDRQDFFSVGVTSSIQVILNEFFVLRSDDQHRYDDQEGYSYCNRLDIAASQNRSAIQPEIESGECPLTKTYAV